MGCGIQYRYQRILQHETHGRFGLLFRSVNAQRGNSPAAHAHFVNGDQNRSACLKPALSSVFSFRLSVDRMHSACRGVDYSMASMATTYNTR